MRRRVIPAVVGLVAALASACGSGGTARPAERVVATTTILADLVKPVAAACGLEVTAVIGSGIDPHAFSPSPRDGEAMRAAVIVVANGGGLEESLLDVLDAVRDAGTPVFEALDHVDTLTRGRDDDQNGDDGNGDEGSEAHDEGAVDPHFWHDPDRAAAVVAAFGAALAGARPEAQRCATDAARERAAELRRLAEEIEEILAAVPPQRRRLVTDHDSFGYFADRFGFEVVGSVIPSTSSLAQASAADLGELVEAVEVAGVPAVFSDASGSQRLVEALRGELEGVEVVALHSDSLGGDVDSYEELVRSNAQAIAAALAP